MWLCFWFEFVFSFFFVGFHSLGIFGFVCVCFRVVFFMNVFMILDPILL